MEKSLRKAQLSIEYLGGFTIFIAIIIYVFFMMLSIIPQHMQISDENILESSAWGATQNLIDYLSLKKDWVVNESALDIISGCRTYNANPNDANALASVSNYTFIQNNILNISSVNDFNIQVDQYLIALTTKKNILNFTGILILPKNSVFFETIYNASNLQYDSVLVDNGTNQVIVSSKINNNIVYLSSVKYYIDKIDIKGQFVILKTNLVDCGRQASSNAQITQYERYLKRNNNFLGIKLTFWRY